MITASIVKELRDKTNAGMMDCKKVLTETNGDIEASIKLLRERGIAKAGAKADRAANEGVITARVNAHRHHRHPARSQLRDRLRFQERQLPGLRRRRSPTPWPPPTPPTTPPRSPSTLGEYSLEDTVKAKVVEVGENLQFRKYVRYDAAPGGVIASYIHLRGKVGVLIEVGTTKAETAGTDTFKELIKDLTLHIAACAPKGLSREDIPAVRGRQRTGHLPRPPRRQRQARQHHREHPQGPDRQVLRRELLPRAGLREGRQASTVTQLLEAKGKELGDTLTVTRFVRFGLGE